MAGADVTDTSVGYRNRIEQWRKVRDCLEGEERIRERSTEYLPKARGMKKQDYFNYLMRASFYAVTDRTLRGMTGLVFRIEPLIELPPRMEALLNMATVEGFTMNQVIREGIREVLSLGRYGILVDMAAQPSSSGLPYLATYKAEDIFRWEEATIDGRRMLMRVVVREESETHEARTTTVLRELVITTENTLTVEGGLPLGIYVQNVYEEVESERNTRTVVSRSQEDQDLISGQFRLVNTVVPKINGKPLHEIPFWFINPFDMRPRPDKPPFLDLVNTNLAHYRNSADYEHALYLTACPTPFFFGVKKTEKPAGIGPGTLWWSESTDAKAGYIEFNGAGLSAQRTALRDKEERMAALGARLIKDVERPNVTAETTRLQTRAETSVMISAVQTTEEAFEQALRFVAFWARADARTVKVKMNRDYVETRLDANEILALVAGWQAGAYSKRTLHEQFRSGEIIPPGRSFEEEQDLIEEEADEMRGPPVPPASKEPDDGSA